MNRPNQSGNSTTPILIFLGIVSLSVVFFFVFTLPRRNAKKSDPAQPIVSASGNGAGASGSTAPPVPATTSPNIQPAPPPVPAKPFFVKTSQLVAAVGEKLAAGRADEVLDFTAAPLPGPKAEALRQIFGPGGFRPAVSGEGAREIGRIGTLERWSLPVEKGPSLDLSPGDPSGGTAPGSTAPTIPETPTAKPQLSLEVDLKATREAGVQIGDIRFPLTLVQAAQPVLQAKGLALDPVALADPQDPLALSVDFLTQLLGHNFHLARGMTDEAKLTHEKLAGLCIVFEEGDYSMAAQGPLNVTAANDKSAWAIVRVQSRKQPEQKGEFGIEMSREGQRGWKVDALDFSKLLQSYVQATDAGKVYYSPVVQSPNGGESLVVYFEYDKAELTDRAVRQLEIVAGLLKSDAARKLRLTGHADALGAEDYNFKLSKRRADNVMEKLKELGVDPKQVVTKGFGSTTPLEANQKDDGTDNPEGRSRNRRTEIFLDF